MANDSQLPALIGETLPAVLGDDLPDRPGDFDEWTTEAIDEFIGQRGSAIGRYEAKLESVRLAVGLALHVLRDRVEEGVYGQDVNRLAGLIGVHEGTLRRWRTRAETHYRLDSPEKAAKRAEAARKAAEAKLRANARSSHEQAIETTAERVPNRTLDLEEAESAGSQPVAAAPTGRTPLTPSPEEEDKVIRDLVLTLLAIDPAVLARVMKRSALVNLEGLAKRAQQLAPTQAAPAAPSTTTKVKGKKAAHKPTATKRPKPGEPCPHPREAHDGLDMSGVTCTWCGESALTVVSLLRMGERAMAAAK